jgi:hypothetical protein
MDEELNDVQVNNTICQTSASLAKLDRNNRYNSIKEAEEDDKYLSCLDRICKECGQDHSFTNNFEGVKTSIDALTELFPQYFRKREALSN